MNVLRGVRSIQEIDSDSSETNQEGIKKEEALIAINSVIVLIKEEKRIIKILNDEAALSGATAERNHQAHHLTVDGRQSQLAPKSTKLDGPKGAATFDRLIYLLDRYLDFCRSVELIAWPIHHLKVSIWLQNDVIAASKNSRMKPLRKTVRCYVTTLESIRIKTSHLFHPSSHQAHLMQSQLIQEILASLSSERDNLQQRLGTTQIELDPIDSIDPQSQPERENLLALIRSHSGDHRAEEAMGVVTAARGSSLAAFQADSPPSTPSKKHKPRYKPDPHLHTLKRYRNFCFVNRIPMWPIEPLRISFWLRESVLLAETRHHKDKRSAVSLRTVQVYLSRLEFARTRTEELFKSDFPHHGSLYKAEEIIEILHQLGSTHRQDPPTHHSIHPTLPSSTKPSRLSLEIQSELEIKSNTHFIHRSYTPEGSIESHHQAWPSSISQPETPHSSNSKRKFDQSSDQDSEVPSHKHLRLSLEPDHQIHLEEPRASQDCFRWEEESDEEAKMKSDPREIKSNRLIRSRRPAPLSIESRKSKASQVIYRSSALTPSRALPAISDWLTNTTKMIPKSPSPIKKGCIAFILCSDEDSETSFEVSRGHQPGWRSSIQSPTHLSASNDSEISLSPLQLTRSPLLPRSFSTYHQTSDLRST